MEQFQLLEGDRTLKASREQINNALSTVRSLSSGTAFPTTNLSEGMLCYRTDLGRLYQLADADSAVWTDRIAMSIAGTSGSADSVSWANVEYKPTAYPAEEHTHLYAGASTAGGSATKADALATPHTINGTPFDGTTDITIVNTIAQGGTGATTAENARDNLGLATAITAASISGKTITLTLADGTTQTLTTQDTAPFTESAATIGDASTTKPAVVVSSYQSGNSWYRVYSDGWIEQGGYVSGSGYNAKTITLHKAYTTTNYIAISTSDSIYNVSSGFGGCGNRTTTTFQSYQHAGHFWYACGV